MPLGAEPSYDPYILDRLRKRTDRFVIWPLWIPIAAALVQSTAASFDREPTGIGMLLFMLAGLVVGVWLVVVLVAAGVAASDRVWRRAASLVAILVCAWPAMQMTYSIHRLLAPPLASFYASEIAAAPAACRDRHGTPITISRRSIGLVWGGGTDEALICDPTGQLAAHVGSCRLLADTARSVVHLGGPFYVVSFADGVDERWLREARYCSSLDILPAPL